MKHDLTNYTYQQISETAIRYEGPDGDYVEVGEIIKGEMLTRIVDGKPQDYEPWRDLRESGLEIAPIPQSVIDAQAEQARLRARDAQKRAGALIDGHTISLTEENQNGLAAVMQGVNLASEMGQPIFPINFRAQTQDGYALIPFTDESTFKGFCLQFMAARQAFF